MKALELIWNKTFLFHAYLFIFPCGEEKKVILKENILCEKEIKLHQFWQNDGLLITKSMCCDNLGTVDILKEKRQYCFLLQNV